MPDDLREPIAEVVHDLWASWTRFVLSQCYHTAAGLVIPPLLLDKWTRQAATPYPALPEAEKNIDRAEADWLIKRFNAGG
jgi:hypothetical protein